MRLIDADELLSIVRHMTVVDKSVMHRILIQMPTVDAVPVRCKDCLYWQKSNLFSEHMVCRYVVDCSVVRRESDFCSRGKRKDGEAHG